VEDERARFDQDQELDHGHHEYDYDSGQTAEHTADLAEGADLGW
jgi:hypothetical protein